METAWEAEQTMSLQVSYLCGGNEVGLQWEGLSLLRGRPRPLQAPGVVMVWSREQPPLCKCVSPTRGSRATESPCSGAEGSLLGAAGDVTGHEQRREEEGGVHGAD